MHLLPTQDEVMRILRETGALRDGHFEYSNGLHSDGYLQVPLALRYYQNARTLSVALSRMLRSHAEIRAMIGDLSIVAPTTGGLPIAYGICETLRAHQVYWVERHDHTLPARLRQFLEPHTGEKVVMADDILRSGQKFLELKEILEAAGAEVVAVAAVVYQPTPKTIDLGVPTYYLAKLDACYYTDVADCKLCQKGVPLERVWV